MKGEVRPPDVWRLGRRWLIRQYRVTQPRAELERKARKARGRACRYPVEDSDLHGHAMAIADLRIDAMFPTECMPQTFCHLCHSFAPIGQAVTQHRRGCSFGPDRKALLAFYRHRLQCCPEFRSWPMPRPYGETTAATSATNPAGRTALGLAQAQEGGE